MKKLYELAIFHPLVMDEGWAKVQQVIQNMVVATLLRKLTKSQIEMMEVKNYHYWDPNFPEKGKDQGLLEHLIFDALNSASTFDTTGHFYAQLYLNDLKKFTGISDLAQFTAEVEDINKRWSKLAEFKIIGTPRENPEVSFSLLVG